MITRGSFGLLAPVKYGLTFNSMLDHLMRGEFDVDPFTIGKEAFVHDGKAYAYFGIFPALLRIPVWAMRGLRDVDVTVTSCVVASSVAAFFKVTTLMALRRALGAARLPASVLSMVALAVLLGGPQVQFLNPSIYQEVVCWAGAIASAYVCCAVWGLIVRRRFSTRLLAMMAALSGLEALDRTSTGLGLYLATGLLALSSAWEKRAVSVAAPAERFPSRMKSSWAALAPVFAPQTVVTFTILALFAAVSATVNYGRWGSPWATTPFHWNLLMQGNPSRMARVDQFGRLNVHRLWFGLMYYLVPVWTVVRSDGNLVFHEFREKLVDGVELPPSSFLVSDPLLVLLVGLLLWRGVRARRCGAIDVRQASLLLAGLTAPMAVACMNLYFAFRYRVEFYPFLELAGFMGLYGWCFQAGGDAQPRARRMVTWVRYLAVLQVLSSHLLLVAYRLAPLGTPDVAWMEAHYPWVLVRL